MSRNWVAKNDFNRASVHTDQKKSWEPDTAQGLNEYYESSSDDQLLEPGEIVDCFLDDMRSLSLAEYYRGVNASGIC